MKNIIKKKLSTIAGISLSIVSVISMSFKSQESIETKAQETSFSQIENNALTNKFNEAKRAYGQEYGVTETRVRILAVGGYANSDTEKNQDLHYKISNFD